MRAGQFADFKLMHYPIAGFVSKPSGKQARNGLTSGVKFNSPANSAWCIFASNTFAEALVRGFPLQRLASRHRVIWM